ncbi:UNKNOWN [Stylonychia lemnae]|uniref:Uncharacterized protein n=1 Tax=Stylonychia lemnae TaxID=5949 RepID=A0A078ABS5_STYLE|nr:UNKNOWN [Stylonychia lemnae]|eukprot:CDW78233.1 UNKNOWN [Stylonychia lemnae]
MITEREEIFTTAELNKTDLFPNYIVVRRQINNETNDAGEWQGFIRDLKQTIRKTVSKSKSEVISTHQSELSNLKKLIDGFQKEDFVQLKHEIKQEIEQKVQTIRGDMDGLKVEIKGDMDFLKTSISQILQKLNNQSADI